MMALQRAKAADNRDKSAHDRRAALSTMNHQSRWLLTETSCNAASHRVAGLSSAMARCQIYLFPTLYNTVLDIGKPSSLDKVPIAGGRPTSRTAARAVRAGLHSAARLCLQGQNGCTYGLVRASGTL
jgi:hypothetical protein